MGYRIASNTQPFQPLPQCTSGFQVPFPRIISSCHTLSNAFGNLLNRFLF
jgi:hypothetical protein